MSNTRDQNRIIIGFESQPMPKSDKMLTFVIAGTIILGMAVVLLASDFLKQKILPGQNNLLTDSTTIKGERPLSQPWLPQNTRTLERMQERLQKMGIQSPIHGSNDGFAEL